ncbi:MAG: hypothetical protein AAGF26_01230, partial [Cyanobacteria bacterium P01_G01_bin.49]
GLGPLHTYIVILSILFSSLVIYFNLFVLPNKIELLVATEVRSTEVNKYLLSVGYIFVMFSLTVYTSVLSWNNLEIRDKGIWYKNGIAWQDIANYSWSEEKPHLLIIQHLNNGKKENKSKIAIAPQEKTQIDSILKDKLNNIVE